MLSSVIVSALGLATKDDESYVSDKFWSFLESATYYAPLVLSPDEPADPDSTAVPYTGDTVLASGGVENPAVTIKWSKTKKIYVPLWPVVGVVVLLIVYFVWRRVRRQRRERQRQTVYRQV